MKRINALRTSYNSNMIPEHQKQSFIDELFTTFCIVLLNRGDDFDISGNAVMIAPNIAITARHVLLQNTVGSFRDLDRSKTGEIFYPDDSLKLLISSKKYQKDFILNVTRAVFPGGADLSILYLEDKTGLMPDNIWNEITLNITPPALDSHVFTVGSLLTPGGHVIQGNIINIDPQYVGSFGNVLNFMISNPIYHCPGFYASLTSFNTQSGSPVYNKNKELVGVISGGANDDTTYVSVLYPLFTNSFAVGGDDAFHLYDLAKKGTIDCKSLDRIKISGDIVNIELPKELKD